MSMSSWKSQSRPKTLAIAAAAAIVPITAALPASADAAANGPLGVWIDHTKRGAVEITDCGGKLCGKVVWVKDTTDQFACGKQVIGSAKQAKPGQWTGGWIYDPEEKERYALVLTTVDADTLRLVGSAAFGLVSETMIWTRAKTPLEPCKA
jgi:uncharacterized protein (DUF2147 family)